MTNLLRSTEPLVPKQSRTENIINGSDAESFALARIVLACRGEGQWGSRAEDNSKIDLILSAEHPWKKGERMLVLSQVKSGKYFGEKHDDGFKLKASAKKAAKRTTHNICVVWVDRDQNNLFWAYLHPNSTADTQKYGGHHRVTPAMVYDLARCASETMITPIGGRGLVIPCRSAEFATRRKSALKAYRNADNAASPNLGEIEFTRLGWRHMFRRSRTKTNKSASIDLIPYLPVLLERNPSRSRVTSTVYSLADGFEYRHCDHLLEFDGIKIIHDGGDERKEVTAFVKLVEGIRYPCDWSDRAMLSQIVDRRVVLKSAYYKSI